VGATRGERAAAIEAVEGFGNHFRTPLRARIRLAKPAGQNGLMPLKPEDALGPLHNKPRKVRHLEYRRKPEIAAPNACVVEIYLCSCMPIPQDILIKFIRIYPGSARAGAQTNKIPPRFLSASTKYESRPDICLILTRKAVSNLSLKRPERTEGGTGSPG
ncbi:hypothetical protein, partial [Mesorhizobium sp.]|uniref:hypothetical protein n=1 Tax=Mesorhizobium sp. TaxID=1871066 RepID=UPI0025C50461